MNRFFMRMAICGTICLANAAHARNLSSGTFEVGVDSELTNASLSSDPDVDDRANRGSLGFSVISSLYIAPNVGLGLTWEYKALKRTTDDAGDEKETSNLVGIAMSYNVSSSARTSLRLFGAVALGGIEENTALNGASRSDAWAWTGAGQLSYFLRDWMSLDATLGYQSIRLRDDQIDTEFDNDTLFVTGGLSVYVNRF